MRWSPKGKYPQVKKGVYVDSNAEIIGNVGIGGNVFVGPGAVLRADEDESAIVLDGYCCIQDNVVLHAGTDGLIKIKEHVTLSSGCILEKQCTVGNQCFIGVGSVIVNSTIGNKVIIKHRVVIENVEIPEGKVVESGTVLSCEADVKKLKNVDEKHEKEVIKLIEGSIDLAKEYIRDERGKTL